MKDKLEAKIQEQAQLDEIRKMAFGQSTGTSPIRSVGAKSRDIGSVKGRNQAANASAVRSSMDSFGARKRKRSRASGQHATIDIQDQ